MAPWPADPSIALKLSEKTFATIDDLIKKGEIEEHSFFPDGTSGYVIAKGEATDIFRNLSMFQPYILGEVHEIIPNEKAKEILLALRRARVEAK